MAVDISSDAETQVMCNEKLILKEMIIVNTTFVISTNICSNVLEWIRTAYLPSALHCGAISNHTLLAKVLVADSPESLTYAIHIGFDDIKSAEKWGEGIGASLRRILSDRWGERAVSFHTYLEPIEI